MIVKICGLTNLEDARVALEAGADLLGFTFYPPSPRAIAPAACAEIVRALRADVQGGVATGAVRLVGLFVNASVAEVEATMTACGLDLAQLHGDEGVAVVSAHRGRAYKAFRGNGQAHAEYAEAGPGAPAFLVDAAVAGKYGGTGQTGDWDGAAALARSWPLLLAGGLTPENVAGAIGRVRPWGVDVASGVEAGPGKKDHAKVRAFVDRAKGKQDWR
jgi:phosphoribosylanthranilate isomerase